MSNSSQAIGIDLGTTNSVATFFDGKESRVLQSNRADGLVPSVVVYRKPRGKNKESAGEFLVGQAAADYAFKDPANAIVSVKRLMGRAFSDPKMEAVRERTSFTTKQSSDDEDPGVRIELGGKTYSPDDISAMILSRIKENAERALGHDVTHAVITVPAYFEERQRAATRLAGEKAGLIVKKIIDEPTAAAIAYGVTISAGTRQRLLVFDLGGGTFDVSIIMATLGPKGKPHFEVLETSGDNWLGGDDFDEQIVKTICAGIEDEYGHDMSEDRAFLLHAKQAAERAKIQLSSAEQADIILPAACRSPDGDFLDLDLTISRKEFEDQIADSVKRCMSHVSKALSREGLTAEDIDRVLMVGGSTLVPAVQKKVSEFFGKEKVQQVMNPYHAVAMGAGILAATMQGIECPNEKCGHVNDESEQNCVKCGEPLATAAAAGDVSIGEVTAMNFGIDAVRDGEADQFEILIPKGTPYPLKEPKARRFRTSQDNFICLHVYEGTEGKASRNDEQGVIEVNEEDFSAEDVNVPAGTDVDVSMNYTRDRELYVIVRVPGTNFVKSSMLRRDRAHSAVASDDKWLEDLEHLLAVAEHFKGKYIGYMEPKEQMRLDKEIERAQTARSLGNPVEGRAVVRYLTGAIDACGVASLLFLAERVSEGASGDRPRKINDVCARIKSAWWEKDQKTVAELTGPLRTVVAAELSSRRGPKQVAGQEAFGGALITD